MKGRDIDPLPRILSRLERFSHEQKQDTNRMSLDTKKFTPPPETPETPEQSSAGGKNLLLVVLLWLGLEREVTRVARLVFFILTRAGQLR